MSDYLDKIIDEIIEELTPIEIQKLFNGEKFFSEKEMGEIILELLTANQLDKVKIILASESFKKNAKCINSCGLPVIQTLLYLVQSIFDSEMEYPRKISYKNEIYSILTNPDYPLVWNLTDDNYNSALHGIAFVAKYFTNKEINTLVAKAINANVNPLNRNISGLNCLDIFVRKSGKRYQQLITFLAANSDKFILEITNATYA